MRNQKAQTQLKRLVALFESGDMPKAIAKTYLKPVDVPCSKWSLRNRLLTILAGTDDARGYRQWQEIGRQVKQGSKAFYILAPQTWKKEVENPDTEEIETRQGTYFKAVPVFKYEDTDGKELERPDYNPPEAPPLQEIADHWGIKVQYTGKISSYWGYYRPNADTITLCTHDSSVFFHELSHAAHARIKGNLNPGQDWRQEIVAELSAAVLAAMHGLAWEKHSYKYIQSYTPKGESITSAIMKVLSDVEKVLDLLLQHSADSRQAA